MNKSGLEYDVYIFDLDGTLTESEPGIINSVQYALEKMNAPVSDRQLLRPFVGPPLVYSFVNTLHMTEDEAMRTVRFFQERYRRAGYLENSVYTGIPNMLRKLKALGAHLAVATAKPKEFAEKVLAAFGLDGYFDIVAAPMDEDEAKSKERLVRKVLAVESGRAVMVGDRDLDILAAKACGIDAIGALYGYGTREELESAGPVAICETVGELTKLLTGSDEVMPGAFISLEGCDGCGKSTQGKMLAQWLETRGYEVVRTREPGGCDVAERVREILLSPDTKGMTGICEAYLFAAARSQHVREVIKPAVERGAVVVCDRFVHSSIAYQGAGRGLGIDAVREINAIAVDGCLPDVAIWLDVDPALALERRFANNNPDRIERENAGFMNVVREGYAKIAAMDGTLTRVDASGEPEEVFQRVVGALKGIL
ncbi:MAG: dTMP kinase [Clostridia bacterium]|nr:dTMP kinase [Clostridia bacterium]